MTQPEAHLDLDALADLLAGEGTDDDVAHVGACVRCSADLGDLDDALGPVADDLAALAGQPVPAPPADLEERLRAGLAAEPAPLRATASADVVPDALPPERPRDVVPLRPARRAPARRAAPALLGVAAASAALVALVGLGIGAGGSSGSGDSASSAGGGAAERTDAALPDVRVSATGTDYERDGRALAAALPALLRAPGRVAAESDQGLPSQPSQPAAPAAPAPGGLSPRPGALAEQLATPGVDPLARLRDPTELAGCLSALTGPDVEGVPLALDYASFEGAPALVVVLPSTGSDRVDVYTVGAGCRAGDDRTLLFSRLPRP